MKKSVFTLCAALFSCPSFACTGVQVVDGWIRQAPPGATVMAGYVQLKNTGDKPRRISAIASPRFGAIEVHQTVIEDGESRMLALDSIDIPPHETVALKPGGMHLMLFRPKQPQLKAGEQTVLSFRCGKAKPVKATFSVKAAE